MAGLSYIKSKHRKKITIFLFCCFIVFIALCYFVFVSSHESITENTSTLKTSSVTMSQHKYIMKITSPAFISNTSIPIKYTCDGEGINPPLEFSGVPSKAKSLVMVMDDPDVPKQLYPSGVFDHWVVYNIDPTVTSIKENSTPPGE